MRGRRSTLTGTSANEDLQAPFDLQPRVKPSGQRFAAKSAMWCSQPQFIYLNIGVL